VTVRLERLIMLVHIKVPGIVGHLMGVILHALAMETHLVHRAVVR